MRYLCRVKQPLTGELGPEYRQGSVSWLGPEYRQGSASGLRPDYYHGFDYRRDPSTGRDPHAAWDSITSQDASTTGT